MHSIDQLRDWKVCAGKICIGRDVKRYFEKMHTERKWKSKFRPPVTCNSQTIPSEKEKTNDVPLSSHGLRNPWSKSPLIFEPPMVTLHLIFSCPLLDVSGAGIWGSQRFDLSHHQVAKLSKNAVPRTRSLRRVITEYDPAYCTLILVCDFPELIYFPIDVAYWEQQPREGYSESTVSCKAFRVPNLGAHQFWMRLNTVLFWQIPEGQCQPFVPTWSQSQVGSLPRSRSPVSYLMRPLRPFSSFWRSWLNTPEMKISF